MAELLHRLAFATQVQESGCSGSALPVRMHVHTSESDCGVTMRGSACVPKQFFGSVIGDWRQSSVSMMQSGLPLSVAVERIDPRRVAGTSRAAAWTYRVAGGAVAVATLVVALADDVVRVDVRERARVDWMSAICMSPASSTACPISTRSLPSSLAQSRNDGMKRGGPGQSSSTRGSWHSPILQAGWALVLLMVSVIEHLGGRHWTASAALASWLPASLSFTQLTKSSMVRTSSGATGGGGGAAGAQSSPKVREEEHGPESDEPAPSEKRRHRTRGRRLLRRASPSHADGRTTPTLPFPRVERADSPTLCR